MVRQKKTGPALGKISLEELLELEKELETVDPNELKSAEQQKLKLIQTIIKRIREGKSVHEVIRDTVQEGVGEAYKSADYREYVQDMYHERDYESLVKQKRDELYAILDDLDNQLQGKDFKEATAIFSSLLDIQNQVCIQKTEGLIVIRTRLQHFFAADSGGGGVPKEFRQEISLIFTPDEVHAIRLRLSEMEESDPLKSFFTMILDQAFDVIEHSELSGSLLIEMTRYFLNRLHMHGFGDNAQVSDFQSRHERSKLQMKKSLDDLKHLEALLNRHIRERPILKEFPVLLRKLIKIKLGLLDESLTNHILYTVKSKLGEYARARGAVSFDFNRLPSHQHGVRLRHSIILNLQKDILRFTAKNLQKEFEAAERELQKILGDIEAQSKELDPKSPEFQELLRLKTMAQQRLEASRKRLDILSSQMNLVDCQHHFVRQAVKRYQETENSLLSEEAIEKVKRPKLEYSKLDVDSARRRENSRMVSHRIKET